MLTYRNCETSNIRFLLNSTQELLIFREQSADTMQGCLAANIVSMLSDWSGSILLKNSKFSGWENLEFFNRIRLFQIAGVLIALAT